MKQRLITAIIALIIIVPIVWFGDLPFLLLAYFLGTVGLYEMIRMFAPQHTIAQFIVTAPFLWYILYPYENIYLSNQQAVILFVIVLFGSMVFSKNKFTFDEASRLVISLLYISTSVMYLVHIRETGLAYLLFVLFIIWTTDSGAYFAGRFLGKRKLWPAISPNKTIAGALGGLLLSIIVAMIFQLIHPLDFSFGIIILLALIISIVGQVGDLVASAIKRHYDIKDYGNIFPGHGGVLDRLDSVLFVSLILYCLQLI
ncbi:MAG TPA: phosphatidate cytidylyltransferase [Pseudogracilibacillus sp.]|nr:phosphatidate cytidylyltransferase [Pseudogracilibacillus sp.]